MAAAEVEEEMSLTLIHYDAYLCSRCFMVVSRFSWLQIAATSFEHIGRVASYECPHNWSGRRGLSNTSFIHFGTLIFVSFFFFQDKRHM